MTYQIDKKGNIQLVAEIGEISVLKHALNNRKTLLQKVNSDEKLINEAKTLLIILDSALIDGNRIKLDSLIPVEVIDEPKVKRPGFFERILNLFDPPFSIADFDNARSVSGEKVFITSMDFHEGGRSHPTNVTGHVFHNGQWFDASWSRNGTCKCNAIGINAVKFNLLRNEPTPVKNAKWAEIVWGIILISAIILIATL